MKFKLGEVVQLGAVHFAVTGVKYEEDPPFEGDLVELRLSRVILRSPADKEILRARDKRRRQ